MSAATSHGARTGRKPLILELCSVVLHISLAKLAPNSGNIWRDFLFPLILTCLLKYEDNRASNELAMSRRYWLRNDAKLELLIVVELSENSEIISRTASKKPPAEAASTRWPILKLLWCAFLVPLPNRPATALLITCLGYWDTERLCADYLWTGTLRSMWWHRSRMAAEPCFVTDSDVIRQVHLTHRLLD